MAKEFDKYTYYMKSVQSPEDDVVFLRDTYKEITNKEPGTLTEDFCGTFSICCEWTKLNKNYKAVGIDLSEEPLAYGKEHILPKLDKEQQERVMIINANVMDDGLPKTDVIAAMNFSYFIFKKRDVLKDYIQNCYNRLHDGGVMFADCFGGSDMGEDTEEETDHGKFSYFWHQKDWNPITNEANFAIHFKRKGEKKRKDEFTYDWRIWTIPEVREIMEEVGFSKTFVYWEGTDDDGEGDGNFTATEMGEDCEGWIAYIVGQK